MKSKILMFIIGLLVGAIITSTGFLIFGNVGNKNKGNKDFEPNKFKEKDGERPSFSRDKENIDFNNIDPSKLPQRPNEN